MNEEIEINKASYYSIIPSTVRYNKNLKYAERLMYGEITALCNVKGYCYATNKYFARLYDVSVETVSRWISDLAKYNYVKVEIIRDNKNKIVERRIYILDNTYLQKEINNSNTQNNSNSNNPSIQNNQYPYCQKNQESIDEKVKENNINNNIINTHIGKKIPYADNVYLFEYEYQDLVAEIGKDKADECIKELSLYKKSKGVIYNDDLATIKRWVISRVDELRNKKEKQNKNKSKSNFGQRNYPEGELNCLYANFKNLKELYEN